MGLFDRFVQRLDWQRPDPRTRLEDLPLLAVDMETTSLDPREGAIVSIGWVPINGGVIDLGGADYVLIKGATAGQIEQSVHIHMLTQDVVDAGVAEKEGISRLREALQGRALLAHFAALEVGFLRPPASEFTELRRALMWWIPLRWNGATWNAWPRTRVGRISALRAFGSALRLAQLRQSQCA